MPLPIVLLVLAGQAAVTPAPSTTPSGEVVVTGRRPSDAYARCLAQQCPPEEEVDRALDAAMEQFRRGEYLTAREVLQTSLGRNRRHAARMPNKVSDLYATYADVSLHAGFVRDYRAATYRSADVLRKYRGAGHPDTLLTELSVADMQVREGNSATADAIYRRTADRARAAGDERLAALILVRRAWVATQMKAGRLATELLSQIPATQAADPTVANLSRAIRTRIAFQRNDEAAIAALLTEWRTHPAAAPVLIDQPDDPVLADTSGFGGAEDYRWVDIGYWITPSGAVGQAETLRPERAESWARPLLRQIARRRYAPLDEPPGSPGRYRIERISVRSDLDIPTGTRLMVRSGPIKFLRADLTQPATTAQAASTP